MISTDFAVRSENAMPIVDSWQLSGGMQAAVCRAACARRRRLSAVGQAMSAETRASADVLAGYGSTSAAARGSHRHCECAFASRFRRRRPSPLSIASTIATCSSNATSARAGFRARAVAVETELIVQMVEQHGFEPLIAGERERLSRGNRCRTYFAGRPPRTSARDPSRASTAGCEAP